MPKISERTLRKWRKEALQDLKTTEEDNQEWVKYVDVVDMNQRILSLTQILLDQYLLEKK